MNKENLVKALSIITGLTLLAIVIYSIVNQNWVDALFCCVIFSCGKKGDPIYEDQQKKSSLRNIQTNKV